MKKTDYDFDMKSDDVGNMDFDLVEQEAIPDPLEAVDYSRCKGVGDEAKAEVSALLTAFKTRQQQESKRFQDATDSEYWFAVCFRTRDEKEAFLKKFNLIGLGDKYLPGDKVDKALTSR